METTNTLDMALACYPSNCSITRDLSKNQSNILSSFESDLNDAAADFAKDKDGHFEEDDQG